MRVTEHHDEAVVVALQSCRGCAEESYVIQDGAVTAFTPDLNGPGARNNVSSVRSLALYSINRNEYHDVWHINSSSLQ